MRYQKVGRLVTLTGYATISNAGTGAGYVTVNLPYAPVQNSAGSGADLGASGKAIQFFAVGGAAQARLLFYDGSYPGITNANLVFSMTYESAS